MIVVGSVEGCERVDVGGLVYSWSHDPVTDSRPVLSRHVSRRHSNATDPPLPTTPPLCPGTRPLRLSRCSCQVSDDNRSLHLLQLPKHVSYVQHVIPLSPPFTSALNCANLMTPSVLPALSLYICVLSILVLCLSCFSSLVAADSCGDECQDYDCGALYTCNCVSQTRDEPIHSARNGHCSPSAPVSCVSALSTGRLLLLRTRSTPTCVSRRELLAY
jgi:hypothetical protein